MKKNKLQKEYKDKTLAMYFKIAIIGSIICFVGDMLLGCFNPSGSKGMAKFFPFNGAFVEYSISCGNIRGRKRV